MLFSRRCSKEVAFPFQLAQHASFDDSTRVEFRTVPLGYLASRLISERLLDPPKTFSTHGMRSAGARSFFFYAQPLLRCDSQFSNRPPVAMSAAAEILRATAQVIFNFGVKWVVASLGHDTGC